MSRIGKKLIHPTQNEFRDRRRDENETFPELSVRLEKIDSLLLLLDSEEVMVLITVLKHITDYVRQNDDNIALLREKNVMQLMLHKEFYRLSGSVIVRRFALYLAAHIVESMDTLLDVETSRTMAIITVCLDYYVAEEDDFCVEYLSVVINKCLDDPQAVKRVLESTAFVDKLLNATASTTNPDVVLHSFELLEKMLLVQCLDEVQHFIGHPKFPLDRIMCDLSSEFLNVRRAALKVIRLLFLNINESARPFAVGPHKVYVLKQLTNMFCENVRLDETDLVVEVLAVALRHDDLIQLFFEHNLFERYMEHCRRLEFGDMCKSLMVISEAARCSKFLPRLATTEVGEKLVNCLLADGYGAPPVHILVGLNRMLPGPDVLQRLLQAYECGVVTKLLAFIGNVAVDLKTREGSADLLLNLLAVAFHKTAGELFKSNVSSVLAETFGQEAPCQSVDLLLALLKIAERLATNADYRQKLCDHQPLVTSIGTLLMNSFAASAIVVQHIFRCLCTIVEEQPVRHGLIQSFVVSSIKRALNSVALCVKTSVTNFIMQTCRFPEFVCQYIEHGVLEGLILQQKDAFGVPTWSLAIDGILSKSPTLKFCIHNHLDFTDLTAGHDFFVSKKKFDDFRVFQAMLQDDVSPLHPVLVVNFERTTSPPEMIVKIPTDCLTPEECGRGEWCYCRTPGDTALPRYLDEIRTKLEEYGLAVNSPNKTNGIDFENTAKMVKIIAEVVARALGNDLKQLDLNGSEECSQQTVQCHLRELAKQLHCNFIPLGHVRSGCQFERAVLFKALADQVGLPCTLQRSVDGRLLFNEVPLPIEGERDIHCDPPTVRFMPWRMLRPTHIVELMYNVGELYPIQSRQAWQYLGFH